MRLLLGILPKLEVLESLLSKLTALNRILERLSTIDLRITELDILHATAAVAKLESLDVSVKKIEQIAVSQTVTVPAHTNGNSHDVKRLQVLNKFAQLSGKAREIELEWQKIQQNEHDALYAFQCTLQDENKQDYFYKKGITEGIKWCVNHFS